MTNPTLDRLLELDDEIERIGYMMKELAMSSQRYKDLDEIYNRKTQEKQSLKSQLESKLADADKYQKLDWLWSEKCWNCKSGRISRNEQTHTELCLDCGNGGTVPIVVRTQEDRQIQSQHANLVKAIQDKIATLESEKQQLLKKLECARNENTINLENDGKNPNDTDCYPSPTMEIIQDQIDEIIPDIQELQNLLERAKA